MDKDIVPELLAIIEKEFDEKTFSSTKLKKALQALNDKKATYADANEFAIEVGDTLAEVLGKNITAEVLPDGKMYYNIADRIFNSTMSKNHELISSYAADVQTELNYNAGLKIKGQKAPLNQDRINGIVERLSAEDDFSTISWILDEPIKNFSQAIVDDTVKTNVDFQAKAGLQPKIVRKEMGNCCDWCKEVVGTYTYPDVPEDIYKRHRYCRCTVEYDPGDGRRQNVHTKKWLDPEKDAKIEVRKQIGREDEFHNTTPAKFSRAVEDAKMQVPENMRWRVSSYPPEHYVGSKLHLSAKGSTAAVDRNGDIVSVCRRGDDTIRGSELLKDAVKNGGIKLDSYAGNHDFYTKNGFEPISWCGWVDEYAPPDWKDGFEREPIVFYKYTGKPSGVTLEDFITQVPASADYDTAMSIRDERIGK